MNQNNLIIPLIIHGKGFKELWVNPEISSIAEIDSETGYDDNVHRIYLGNSKGEMFLHILAKSDDLNEYWEDFFKTYEEDQETKDQRKVNKVAKEVRSKLEILFLEDVWAPGGEQFCFTEAGKEIGKLFTKAKKVKFSPDCALTTDGTNFWFDT